MAKKKEKFKALNIEPISIENEYKTMSLLKELCEDKLSKYPNTYEHDLQLLKDPNLTYNQRNCILYRSSEKRVNS